MKNGSVISVKNEPRNATPMLTSGANSAVTSKLASDCSMLLTKATMSASVLGARPSVFTHASMFANAWGSDCRNAAACVVTTPRNATTSAMTTAKNTTIVSSVAMPRGTRLADSQVTIGSRRKARIRPMMNTNFASPTATSTPIVIKVATTATIPAALGIRSRGKPDAVGGRAGGVVIEGASGVTGVGSGKGAVQARAQADVAACGVEQLMEHAERREGQPPGDQQRLAAQGGDGTTREVGELEASEDEQRAGDHERGAPERAERRHEEQRRVEREREHDEHRAARAPRRERQDPRVQPDGEQDAAPDRGSDAEGEDEHGGPEPQDRGDGEHDAEDEARRPARGRRQEPVAQEGAHGLGAEHDARDEPPQRQQHVEHAGAVPGDEGAGEQAHDPEDHGFHVAVSPLGDGLPKGCIVLGWATVRITHPDLAPDQRRRTADVTDAVTRSVRVRATRTARLAPRMPSARMSRDAGTAQTSGPGTGAARPPRPSSGSRPVP